VAHLLPLCKLPRIRSDASASSISCVNFVDWVSSCNRLGHSSPNSPPSSLHPPVPTRILSLCLRHHPTTARPRHPLPTFHLPPIPSLQRPSNPRQKRFHDCQRHPKRTRGTYKGSTRTTKVTARPIAPSLSPLHRRNAPHGGNYVVIHCLRPKHHLTHKNDNAIRQKTTAHPIAPAPRHPSYRPHRSFRSTQKARSRRISTSLLSV
jgi:hypothetical protein